MKHTLIFFVMMVFASSFISPVKTAREKYKHTTIGYSITTDGDVITGSSGQRDLEKFTGLYQTGKGKTTSPVITITGVKSGVRLPSGVSIKFLTNYDTGPMPSDGFVLSPGNDIMLYKFNVDKKNRTSTGPLQIMFTQVDKLKYRIDIPAGVPFGKGEYAFVDKTTLTSTGSISVWCFGID